MKSTIKTITGLIFAAALAFSLTACDKTGDVDEITWYMMKPLDNMSAQSMVEEEVNKVFEKEIGAKLKLNLVDTGSWTEKMNIVINSGEKFDILLTSPSSATSIVTNAKRGTLLDLKPLLDKFGADIKEKVDPRAWDAVTYGDEILAIPSQAKWVQEMGFVFKKDLVEKYGFDYQNVKCLKDLEPYFDTLLANEPGIVPAYINGVGSGLSEPYNGRFTSCDVPGVMFDEEKEEFVSSLSARLEEYRLKHEWYKKGYIAVDVLSRTDSSEAKSGRYAVLRDTGAITPDGSKSSAAYGFPCVEVLVSTDKIPPMNIMNGNAISATSQNPEKAMQMLNLIWKDPYLSNTLSYGVEDVNYAFESGKGTPTPTVIPKTGADRTWTIWHNWIGPLFDQWNSSWNSTEALQAMKSANETGEMSKSVGVMIDVEPLLTEIAALTEVTKASSAVLATGTMDDFEQYIAELEQKLQAAGIDKAIENLNKQYSDMKN